MRLDLTPAQAQVVYAMLAAGEGFGRKAVESGQVDRQMEARIMSDLATVGPVLDRLQQLLARRN